MSRTVYLHVGTAKSGTTYLQRMMMRNRELLRRNGVLYPGRRSSHFYASMDVRGAGFKGYDYPGAAGAWERVVKDARGYDGNTVISHETLVRARPEAIRRAVGSFPEHDVVVLFTCRDIGRQIPATWQERIKNRNDQSYADFLERVFRSWDDDRTSTEALFWRGQNLIELTNRWASVVGPDRVSVVTVPTSGADPDDLWHRFVRAADLPDLPYDMAPHSSNVSLGTAETELLRRLNPYFPDSLTWPQYEKRVKGRFVGKALSRHQTGGRLTVPEQYHGQTEKIAAQMIDHLGSAGFRIYGDLEQLRPQFRAESTLPDDIGAEELLDLSLHVLADLAVRRAPADVEVSGREAVRVVVQKAHERLRRLR